MNNNNIIINDVYYFNNPERIVNGYKIDAHSGMVISWSSNDGFGELMLSKNSDGTYTIDSECMGKEFTIDVLNRYSEYILSKGVLL